VAKVPKLHRFAKLSTYYYELPAYIDEETWEFKSGIYMLQFREQRTTKMYRMFSYSDRVWIQGPRGGVKIVKDDRTNLYGYVTKDTELMKEFMWVKLKAQSLSV
jgi:hypothetical protein